jgi:hypothetical protein
MDNTFLAPNATVGPLRDHYARVLNFENSQHRRLGLSRLPRYLDNRRYFYGEEVEPNDVRMPLHIRYAQTIVQKHAHYLWGQWETDIVDWAAPQILEGKANDKDQDEISAKIVRAVLYLMRRAGANDKLYKAGLNCGIYGDGVLRTRYKREVMGATFESILPEYLHTIWEPLDINDTLEAVIAYNTDRQTAYSKFGTLGNDRTFRKGTILDARMAVVWEWWSPWEFMQVVDDVVVKHMDNPYAPAPILAADGVTYLRQPGFLPFVHVPNMGIDGEYWGFGDSEAIHWLQDEINLRLADMGDIVNYHSHPITVLKNYWGKVRELLVAPDSVWDLGREGDAKYLQWSGPPPQIFEYIEMLIRVMLETTNLSPAAFGRSDQSQANGQTFQMAMLPVTEIVRRKRSQWGPRLSELARQLLMIEEATLGPAVFLDRYGFAILDLARFELGPRFAPILPRDRLQVVNEVTARIVNRTISLLKALETLGEDDPKSEKDRILQDLQDLVRLNLAEQTDLAKLGIAPTASGALPNRSGGKNSTSAKGGSNTDPNPEDS